MYNVHTGDNVIVPFTFLPLIILAKSIGFFFFAVLFNYNLCFGLTLSGPVTWMRARCTMNSIQILDLKIKKISCTFFFLPPPYRKSDSVLACKPFTNIVYSQFLNSFFRTVCSSLAPHRTNELAGCKLHVYIFHVLHGRKFWTRATEHTWKLLIWFTIIFILFENYSYAFNAIRAILS